MADLQKIARNVQKIRQQGGTPAQVNEYISAFNLPEPDAIALRSSVDRGPLQQIGDIATAGAQAASFNYLDEGLAQLGKLFGQNPQDVKRAVQTNIRSAEIMNPGATLGAQVGGSVLPAFVTPAAAFSAPTAFGRIAKTASMGGAMGGLAASGATERQGAARLADIGVGATLGSALGLLGGGAVEAVRPVAGAIGSRVAAALPADVATANTPISAALRGAFGNIAPREAGRVTPQDIPLSRGQASQELESQSLEALALRGGAGESAQRLAQQFRDTQQQAIRGNIQNLMPLGTVPEDAAFGGAAQQVRGMAEGLFGRINQAYDAARQAANQTGAAVDAQFLANRMKERVANITREGGFALSQAPRAETIVRQFDNILARGDGKVTAVKVNALENLRKQILNAAQDTQGTSEAVLLGRVRQAFDDTVGEAIDKGLTTGDDQAINAFRSARDLRREYGKRYEANPVIERIVSDQSLTPESMTNLIIGSGKLSGKTQSGEVVDALLRAAPGAETEVRQQLQQGIMARALNRSFTQEVDAQGTPYISPVKLKNELDALISENKTLAEKVFKPAELQAMAEIRNKLAKIASEKPGSVNYSNTYYALAQAIQRIPAIGRLPFVAQAFQSAGDSKAAVLAERSFGRLAQGMNDTIGSQPTVFANRVAAGAPSEVVRRENKM